MIGAVLSLSLCTVLPGVLAQQGPVSQSPVTPAKKASDSGFETILWLHGGPERDAAFYERLHGMGFTGVNVSSGGNSAGPAAEGLRFYVDQLVPKGVLELRDREWEPLWQAYDSGRDARKLIRPGCLTSPAAQAVIDKSLTRFREVARHRPFAVALGDEVSLTRHANPLDFCVSPTCQDGFRVFLKRRYGEVSRLNTVWQAGYRSFDEVLPWTTDRVRRREVGGAEMPLDMRPWSDHLDYRDALFARVVRLSVESAARMAKSVPVGLTGIQPPSAFGGHDYARLLPELGFYEAYDIGGARALARSFAKPGAVEIATLFRPKHDNMPEWVAARLDDMLSHGMNGVVVWSAAEVFAASGKASAFGHAFDRALRGVSRAKQLFAGAKVEPSSIWIVESQASVRAHWMLDSRKDGPTWTKRLSSYEAQNSTSLAARKSWVRLLQDLGYQPRFVSAKRLQIDLAGSRPKLLILPAQLAMSDVEAGAVYDYVQRGGTVVADHGTGIYDENLVRRKYAACDRLFGLEQRSHELADQLVFGGVAAESGRLASGAAVAELEITGKLAEPQGNSVVQIEKQTGRGRAVYLNLAVCEYAAVRLDRKRTHVARDLRARVRRILERIGMAPPVLVRGKGLPTCIERVMLRTPKGRRLLAIRFHALENPSLQTLLGRIGPKDIRVVFPRDVQLIDAREDKLLGTGSSFDLQLDPWRALLLEVRRPR